MNKNKLFILYYNLYSWYDFVIDTGMNLASEWHIGDSC